MRRARTRNKWKPPTAEERLQAAIADGGLERQPWLEHSTRAALRERLQTTFDCWNLLQAPDGSCRRDLYLPPGAEEPPGCYASRISNARPTGFFRDALRTYAGMLSFIQWLALPPSLQRVISDVDGHGTDLGVFLFMADLLVLRDGGCMILVLPPETTWPSEGHRLEAIRRGQRDSLPRLQLVPRADLLNWVLPLPEAQPQRITWRERLDTPQLPEAFGAIPVHHVDASGRQAERTDSWLYRELTLTDEGISSASMLAACAPGDPAPVACTLARPTLLMERQYLMPAVWYSADGCIFGEGDLPHLGLANQYLTHYRLKSEYEDLLSRCALPVGVRTGVVDEFGLVRDAQGTEKTPERLVLSASTFMDLPAGGDFNWKEIRARSLAEHRAYLLMLEQTMRRDALVPTENTGAGRSPTEISLTAGQAFALLQALATQKTSIFSTILEIWCSMTGDALVDGAGISLTVTPLTPPARPQPTVSEWLDLHERGVITTQELRHQLSIATAPGVVAPVSGSSTASFTPPDPVSTNA